MVSGESGYGEGCRRWRKGENGIHYELTPMGRRTEKDNEENG